MHVRSDQNEAVAGIAVVTTYQNERAKNQHKPDHILATTEARMPNLNLFEVGI